MEKSTSVLLGHVILPDYKLTLRVPEGWSIEPDDNPPFLAEIRDDWDLERGG